MRRSVATPPLGRLSTGLAALVALCGAAWVNPPAASGTASGAASVEPEVRSAKRAPPARSVAVEPQVDQQVTALPQARGSSAPPGAATSRPSSLDVVRWGFGTSLSQAKAAGAPAAIRSGGPLFLAMTLDGGREAVDRLRADGKLAIEVHWTRAGAGRGAPDLVTPLTIGHHGMAPTFAAQVQKDGHFEWHSWARKDALSPGRWTVSLTYPDGTAVRCGSGAAARPCRFSLAVG